MQDNSRWNCHVPFALLCKNTYCKQHLYTKANWKAFVSTSFFEQMNSFIHTDYVFCSTTTIMNRFLSPSSFRISCKKPKSLSISPLASAKFDLSQLTFLNQAALTAIRGEKKADYVNVLLLTDCFNRSISEKFSKCFTYARIIEMLASVKAKANSLDPETTWK